MCSLGECVLLSCLLAGRLAVAASAHALWPRQNYDPVGEGPAPGCTEVSFSYPIWNFYDPWWVLLNSSTPGATFGDFRFAVHSLATNETAECFVQNANLTPSSGGEIVWHNCRDDANTQFWLNFTGSYFEVRQTWTCNDSPTKFVGGKRVPFPIDLGCYKDTDDARGTTTVCLLADVTQQANLFSPIKLSPLPPQRPYAPYPWLEPTCAERSTAPRWEVNDLTYNHTSGSNSSSYPLSFGLINFSNGENIDCTVRVADDALDRTHSDRWADCVAANASSRSNILSTSVMFNKDYDLFGVNQTWRCDGGANAKTYSALAFTTNSLNSTIRAGSNTSNIHASTSSYIYTWPTMNFTGYDSVPPIPHTSYARSCTINSINNTALTLKEFKIETANVTTSQSPKIASLTLFNPGPGDSYKISQMPFRDDGSWHECVAGAVRPLPWQLVSCQYLFDRTTKDIGFRIQWYCDDRDPEFAILFDTTARGRFSLEQCGNSSQGGVESCRLQNDVVGVQLNMVGLTWNTTAGPMDRGPFLPWV